MGEATLPVVATISLSGLRAGQHAIVDPRDPYIAELLSAGFLSPTGAPVYPDEEADSVLAPDPVEPEPPVSVLELPAPELDDVSLFPAADALGEAPADAAG